MSTKVRVSACALLLLSACAAHAEDQGFYFGLSLGLAQYDFSPPDPPVDVLATDLWLPEADDQGFGWSVSAGYRINRYLAVEASYVNLGTLTAPLTVNSSPHPGGAGAETIQTQLQTIGPAITAFGLLPLSDSWELYVRAGMFLAYSKRDRRNDGGPESVESSAPTLGAGAQFDWNDYWSARLEFQRTFDIGGDEGTNKADVDTISLAVVYRL